MSGQATVVINDIQWTVSVATTNAELLSGLSGVSTIPAQTGILFDLGSITSAITVNTSEMLFNMDVLFITSGLVVVGKLSDVAPGEDAFFIGGDGPGARYFLEVNAGEADSISIGDTVIVTTTSISNGSGLNAIIQPLITLMIVVMMMKMMTGVMEESK